MTHKYNFDGIPTTEIKKDILDTERERDNYSEQIRLLKDDPQQNRVQIYVLEGRIREREIFINKLYDELQRRSKLNSSDQNKP